MALDVAGIPVECPRCRNGLPGDARFCRRCGHAQGADPFTRAARGARRAGRRFAYVTHGQVLGADPVLWLFAALGGIAMSVVHNFNNLASSRSVGYSIGATLGLLLCGAVVARVGWHLSGRSQTVSLLGGMAAILFVALGVIAGAANDGRATITGPKDDQWLVSNGPAGTRRAAQAGLPLRSLPAAALGQLPVSWRISGRRLECIVSNQSPWQVEELNVQVIVVANRRVVQTRTFPFKAAIAAGRTTTFALPLQLDSDTRQSVHCQVISAMGFETPPPAPGAGVK